MSNTDTTTDVAERRLANLLCTTETTRVIGATGNRGHDVQLGLIGEHLLPRQDGLVLVLQLDLAIAVRDQLTKAIDEAWAHQLRDARSDPFDCTARGT
jgi:hypothetical protein